MGSSAAEPQSFLTSPAGEPGTNMPVIVGRNEPAMLTGNGLQLPPQLPFERWLAIGMQLSAWCTSAAWYLGDWLVFGENAYTSRYRQAIELTSLDYQTLRNYAWVARRFSLSRRRDKLSIAHHAEVAALPQPEQDFWLRKAEEHHWPVKQLRREVRTSLTQRSADDHEQPNHDQDQHDWINFNLRIHIPPRNLHAYQAAANKLNLSIQDWAALVLEQASSAATARPPEQPSNGPSHTPVKQNGLTAPDESPSPETVDR